MKCPHCPLASEPAGCPAVTRPHPRFCEQLDPSRPEYDPRYEQVLRGLAGAEPSPKLPPLLDRVVGFVRAAATHLAAGRPTLPTDAAAARLAVCGGCDQRTAGGLCAGCGCHLATKAAWADQDCPLGKWPDTSGAS